MHKKTTDFSLRSQNQVSSACHHPLLQGKATCLLLTALHWEEPTSAALLEHPPESVHGCFRHLPRTLARTALSQPDELRPAVPSNRLACYAADGGAAPPLSLGPLAGATGSASGYPGGCVSVWFGRAARGDLWGSRTHQVGTTALSLTVGRALPSAPSPHVHLSSSGSEHRPPLPGRSPSPSQEGAVDGAPPWTARGERRTLASVPSCTQLGPDKPSHSRSHSSRLERCSEERTQARHSQGSRLTKRDFPQIQCHRAKVLFTQQMASVN